MYMYIYMLDYDVSYVDICDVAGKCLNVTGSRPPPTARHKTYRLCAVGQ